MHDVQTFFSDGQKRLIDEAVARAESTTSGEIVPVLAGQSGNYDRGLFLAALTGAVLATAGSIGVACLPIPGVAVVPWALPLYAMLPLQILGLALGYHAALAREDVWRGFIPRKVLQANVMKAAQYAFATMGLHRTREATGILIYVAVFERMVVVLADRAINEKLPHETWDGLRDQLVERLRTDQAAEGFVEAVEACGKILGPLFPIRPDDVNELPDHLRIVS